LCTIVDVDEDDGVDVEVTLLPREDGRNVSDERDQRVVVVVVDDIDEDAPSGVRRPPETRLGWPRVAAIAATR
jgi:hypothetical protein